MASKLLLSILTAFALILSSGNGLRQDFEDLNFDEELVLEKEQIVNFRVRVEFLLHIEEVTTYPDVAVSFGEALDIWQEELPIEAIVYMDHSHFFPFTMGPDPSKRADIIDVRLTDMSKERFRFRSDSLLGIWLPAIRKIYLDADSLLTKDTQIHVALHEIGHALGLGHICFEGSSKPTTGDIILDSSDDPQTYLMFPITNRHSIGARPSELEIMLARNYVLHYMTVPGHLNSSKIYFCK